MFVELRMIDRHWTELREHLLADGDEHAAALICGMLISDGRRTLTVRRVVPLVESDLLDSSSLHLSISPISLARVAKAAGREAGTVVLCHSHPWKGQTYPSELDIRTEADLCGRVLAQRLEPRPAAALVVGTDTFSGRLWISGEPVDIDCVRVVGEQILMLPEPPRDPSAGTYARQVLAWGNIGQSRLARAHVAIVGCGGTGSQVAAQLAHLGVGRLTLFDFDTIEESNLSRIVGSTPQDIGRAKVDVVGAALRAISPNVRVDRVARSIIDVDPSVLIDVDVVVCATDGHGSRALLTELAQQHVLPVVDLGVDVIPTAGAVQAGGQVRVLRPGRGCLHCAGMLDPRLVREEFLSDHERAAEGRRGYLRGVSAPAPAVIALNGVVASLACLEVCQLIAGFLGNASDRVLYRAHRRSVTTAPIPADPDCYVCGAEGLLGLGDGRDLPVRLTVAEA